MEKKHVVIVGAGPGGLTSAMILAKRGFKVTVFEKEPHVGGRNAPIKLDGFTFDTGPTFLMMNYILKEMFVEAGKKIEDYITFVKLDPMYRLKFEDFEIRPSQDREKTKEQIKARFPGNEAGIDAFFEIEARRFARLFPCLQKDYQSLKAFCDPIFLKAFPHLSLGRSLFDNLGRYFNEEKVKVAFTFQAKYLGMSPWQCPALFTILSYLEYAYGIYHVIGGLNAISQAMAKVVRELGGEVVTQTPVKQLILEGKSVKGVELTNGENVCCDDVFINADFAYAMTHLLPQGTVKKYSDQKLRNKKFSCSTFMVYLGVNKTFPDLPHHTVLFAKDYRRNVEEIMGSKILSSDPSVYVQNASVSDPTLAPQGKSTIYLLVPIPNNQSRIDWNAVKDELKAKVIDIAEHKGGFSGLKEHHVVEKVITPQDWEKDYNVYLGATFNLAHNFGQLLYWRPHNKFECLDHCYLVGGGTHPGSGLPTIYESARISSNAICKAYGIPYQKPSSLESKEMIAPKPGTCP